MSSFSTFSSSSSTYRAMAALGFTGAVCGFLYAFIFFGFIVSLLIAGSLAGLLITLFYGMLELIIFPKRIDKTSLTGQYIIRVICYYFLFIISLVFISLLHAGFSQLNSDIVVWNIFMEDYLPLWPAYAMYALLAALVFQSVWLFNKVSSNKSASVAENQAPIIAKNAAIVVISLKPDTTIPQERIISILNKLSSAVTNKKSGAIEYYDHGTIKIYLGENALNNTDVTSLGNFLISELKSHISNSEKMLQLEMGYAFGEIKMQICGSQTLFYGEAVQKAEENLKAINEETWPLNTPALSLLFIF